jgi:type II secretory pathway pseudopilin PulG
VVIAVIGILSSVAMTSLNGARKKARDIRRLSDMEQIRNALELYKLDHGEYPEEDSTGPWGGDWEMSWEDGQEFLTILETGGYFPDGVPLDPVNNTSYYYAYYVYGQGDSECDTAGGEYYVLAVSDMEGSGRPYVGSPGWSCPSRNNWVTSYDWVAGSFTN